MVPSKIIVYLLDHGCISERSLRLLSEKVLLQVHGSRAISILDLQSSQIMTQHFKIESIGSQGSIILAILEVKVGPTWAIGSILLGSLHPPEVDQGSLDSSCH